MVPRQFKRILLREPGNFGHSRRRILISTVSNWSFMPKSSPRWLIFTYWPRNRCIGAIIGWKNYIKKNPSEGPFGNNEWQYKKMITTTFIGPKVMSVQGSKTGVFIEAYRISDFAPLTALWGRILLSPPPRASPMARSEFLWVNLSHKFFRP